MKFEEILPQLRAGLPARSAGSKFKTIRLVNPREERGIDGPISCFKIFKDEQLQTQLGTFETEGEAKAALKAVKAEHTKAWGVFKKERAAFEESIGTEETTLVSEAPKAPVTPSLHINFWKDATIKECPISTRNRLSLPFFIAVGQDHSVTPWAPTSDDILRNDWSIA